LAKHKGAEVVADALDALLAAGFAPEIWGTYYGERKRKVAAKVPLISFSNEDELLRLFETRKPDLMAFPSIWAETFSYVLYEAVILGQIPVIVGPYGNPADEVRKRNIGSVMPSAEGKSLVWSCKEVRGNYATYVENILKFVQDLKSHPSNYREEYLNLVNRSGQETISQAALLPSHFNLSRMDLLAREREGILVRVALLLQAQLRRFPKVEEVIFDMAREVWRGLQRARDKIRSLLPS
jgi:glycosyltransferase involved in cell wall biosynthesis